MPKESEKTDLPPTAPTDPRFPNCNASAFCFMMFVDYHRCTRLYSKGHEPCNHFKNSYQSLCPNAWVQRWEQQIENGTFPYTLPKEN